MMIGHKGALVTTAPRCFGIAYDWTLAPADVDDVDVVLVLAVCSGPSPLTRGTAFERKTFPEPSVDVFHAKLPPQELALEQADVSGTLGLLWPASDHAAQVKASAFERLVADGIVWVLSKHSFPPDEQTIVLIQGPMLPKFRGRILYRGVGDNVLFFAVTFQQEWFGRLEGANTLLKRTLAFNDTSGEALRQTGRPLISPVYPPQGRDHSTRSWICNAGGFPYHIETIANMWDCTSSTDWLGDRTRWIAAIFQDDMLEGAPSGRSASPKLPVVLAQARRSASQRRKLEEDFIQLRREAAPLLAEHTPISNLKVPLGTTFFGMWPEANTPTLERAASSGQRVDRYWISDDDAYQRFLKHREVRKKRSRVDKFS